MVIDGVLVVISKFKWDHNISLYPLWLGELVIEVGRSKSIRQLY